MPTIFASVYEPLLWAIGVAALLMALLLLGWPRSRRRMPLRHATDLHGINLERQERRREAECHPAFDPQELDRLCAGEMRDEDFTRY